MRVRAQLVVAAAAVLAGAAGFVITVHGDGATGHYRHAVHGTSLWWLLPAVVGIAWAQCLVVRYRGALRRRLGQFVPAIFGVAGVGLALIGRSVVIGCGFLSGVALLVVELVVLGGVLGATSPG